MKKSLLIIGILAATLISCGKKEVNNNWKGFNLQGKVKTLKVERYSAYSSFGEIIEDELEETDVYEFNKDGFLVEFSAKGTRIYTFTYTHKGDTITILGLRDNEFNSKSISVLDDQNRVLESTKYDSGGEISWKTVNEYSDNLLTEVYEYDAKGNLWRKKTNYVYKDGKLQSFKTYDSDGDLKETHYFKYDENGFLAEEKENDSNGKTRYRKRYKKDQYGNSLYYSYKGTHSHYDSEEKYELTYDSRHNIIKKVTVDDDNDYEIEIRTITYF